MLYRQWAAKRFGRARDASSGSSTWRRGLLPSCSKGWRLQANRLCLALDGHWTTLEPDQATNHLSCLLALWRTARRLHDGNDRECLLARACASARCILAASTPHPLLFLVNGLARVRTSIRLCVHVKRRVPVRYGTLSIGTVAQQAGGALTLPLRSGATGVPIPAPLPTANRPFFKARSGNRRYWFYSASDVRSATVCTFGVSLERLAPSITRPFLPPITHGVVD